MGADVDLGECLFSVFLGLSGELEPFQPLLPLAAQCARVGEIKAVNAESKNLDFCSGVGTVQITVCVICRCCVTKRRTRCRMVATSMRQRRGAGNARPRLLPSLGGFCLRSVVIGHVRVSRCC